MIPREHYLYQTGYDQVANESDQKYSIDIKEGIKNGWMSQEPTPDGQGSIISLIPKNGIFLAVKGATFPLKCYPDAGVVFAVNLVKAYLMETLKLVGKWYFVPFLLLINRQRALESFVRFGMKAISPHLLKDYCLTDFSREFKKAIKLFLDRIGFESVEEETEGCATILANIMDYDNLYRLRVQDVLSETNKDRLLKRPIREINRLSKIIKQREGKDCAVRVVIHYKFKIFVLALSFALLFPKIRRVFESVIQETDFTKLQYDEIDIYWVCFRNDYLWLGITDEQRKQYAESKGWKYPTAITKQ